MSFISEFKERGFFHQSTDIDAIDKLSKSEKFAAYIGFDCTANSLHIGSLTMIMCLRLLQKHGIKPIVIIGGGTTKIGDPTGKDEARKILTDEDINLNAKGIKSDLSKFIKFGNSNDEAIIVNNDDWLKDIKYTDFLRDYGRHFSINRMLTFDSVKLRLEREQNLSFLEFNYMLLQAYDFAYLNKHYNCRLQIGGSDQWGNIVNGVELNRRIGQKEIFGLTTPLLTTSSGAKMGKTASGAVWLSSDLVSAYDYYQYWRNVDDLDVVRFMLMYTDLEVKEIRSLENYNINELKKILAFETTKLCHGEAAANEAAQLAKRIFEDKDKSGTQIILDLQGKKEILAYQLLVKTGEVKSGGEAKRLIRGKGIKFNDIILEDENQKILFDQQDLRISIGKKKHLIINFK